MHSEVILKKNHLNSILSKKVICIELLIISLLGLTTFYLISLFEKGSITIQLIIWLFNMALILLILVRLKSRKKSFDEFGLTLNKLKKQRIWKTVYYSVIILILALVAFIFGSIVMSLFIDIPQQADMSQYNPIKNNLMLLLLSLFFVAIASSFGEELIYRAYLMDRISRFFKKEKMAKYFSIILSASIFGVAHFQWGLLGIVQTFFMGLVLSISYLKFKGNIWNNVIAHFYMDALLLIQLY